MFYQCKDSNFVSAGQPLQILYQCFISVVYIDGYSLLYVANCPMEISHFLLSQISYIISSKSGIAINNEGLFYMNLIKFYTKVNRMNDHSMTEKRTFFRDQTSLNVTLTKTIVRAHQNQINLNLLSTGKVRSAINIHLVPRTESEVVDLFLICWMF